jgi:hypothetical protein
MLSIGRNIIDGIVNGIKSNISRLANAVSTMGTTAVTSLKTLLGIKSPSRVFRGLGIDVTKGFVAGIKKGYGPVGAAVEGLSQAATDGLGAETNKTSTTTNSPTSSLLSASGNLGGVIEAFSQGGIMGGFTALLAQSEQFAALMEIINPLLQTAANTVGSLITPMLPLVTVVSKVLSPVLMALGNVISSLLLPVFKLLFPIVKFFGLVLVSAAIVIGEIWNALANIIRIATLGMVDLRANMSELYKGMDDLKNLTYDEAAARAENNKQLEKANEALTNVPSIWKAAYARFAASDNTVRSMVDNGSPPGNIVNVTILATDPEATWRKLEPYLETRKYRNTGNRNLALLRG